MQDIPSDTYRFCAFPEGTKDEYIDKFMDIGGEKDQRGRNYWLCTILK